jgi:hypothetical protein
MTAPSKSGLAPRRGAAAVVAPAGRSRDALLKQARAAQAEDHLADAVRSFTAANRLERDPKIDRRLVYLRHRAFHQLVPEPGPPVWPPPCDDPFPDTAGIPELSVDQLSPERLRGGIFHHGAVTVRGLLDEAAVTRMVDDVERALVFHDKSKKGVPFSATLPWFVPFDPLPQYPKELLNLERKWVRSGGGVYTAESPGAMFDLLDVFEDIHLDDALTGYFGERPALSLKKSTLRRTPPTAQGHWHQDGAFIGPGVRAVNVWISLSHCGDTAPGLDLYPRRLPAVLPTGTEDARFDWCVGEPVVDALAADCPIIRPIYEAGDALIFDDLFLHRTGLSPDMTDERYGLETWFFAPSTFPLDQVPILL